jgi:hypothetical protein
VRVQYRSHVGERVPGDCRNLRFSALAEGQSSNCRAPQVVKRQSADTRRRAGLAPRGPESIGGPRSGPLVARYQDQRIDFCCRFQRDLQRHSDADQKASIECAFRRMPTTPVAKDRLVSGRSIARARMPNASAVVRV